jgi:two-component system capsular synthesis sensor histidine kinase RcsC
MSTCKILIVDDDPDILMLFSLFFEDAGAKVKTLENPVRAMDLMASDGDQFELVVVDIRMPGMNGNELTKTIRSTGYTGGIVAFTADVSGGGRRDSQSSGIDAYFSKETMNKDLATALVAKYRKAS